MKKSHLLIDETPLIVLPSLAAFVGINEAIAIQQIHWVCQVKAEHEDYRTFYDDEMWCSYKIDQWLQKMPWLKERTCRRMLNGLEERKILIVTKPHAKDWNHTKWYRIDYGVLDKIGCPIYQKCQTDADKLTGSDRTNLPDLDVDKLTDSSISKKDLKKHSFKKTGKNPNERVRSRHGEIRSLIAERVADVESFLGWKANKLKTYSMYQDCNVSAAVVLQFYANKLPHWDAISGDSQAVANLIELIEADIVQFALPSKPTEARKNDLEGIMPEYQNTPEILELNGEEFQRRFGVTLNKFKSYLFEKGLL